MDGCKVLGDALKIEHLADVYAAVLYKYDIACKCGRSKYAHVSQDIWDMVFASTVDLATIEKMCIAVEFKRRIRAERCMPVDYLSITLPENQ